MTLHPIDTIPRGVPVYAYCPGWAANGPLVYTMLVRSDDRDVWMDSNMRGSMRDHSGFKPEWWVPVPKPPILP